jgi:predicted dehydrogenase
MTIITIGAWGHLGTVITQLSRLGEADFVGMAPAYPGEDIGKLRKDFPTLGRAKVFADHRQLLRQCPADLAIISTRLDLIAPIAIEAAHAGCQLICEKPLAIDHASLRRLWDAIKAVGVQCIAMVDNRAHPVLVATRQLVKGGAIGHVVLCNARKSYKWGERPEWFGQRAIYGGTIPWIGIHATDFIHSATGLLPVKVAAMQSNAAHPARPECEDNCAIILELPNGGHATISVDYLRPPAAPTHGDDWLRIVGTRGVIEAHMAGNRCGIVTDNQPPRDVPLPEREDYFAGIVGRLPQRPAAPMEETLTGFRLTHAALCARDAADEKRIVTIPEWKS